MKEGAKRRWREGDGRDRTAAGVKVVGTYVSRYEGIKGLDTLFSLRLFGSLVVRLFFTCKSGVTDEERRALSLSLPLSLCLSLSVSLCLSPPSLSLPLSLSLSLYVFVYARAHLS